MTRVSRTSGVPPTRSRIESAYRIGRRIASRRARAAAGRPARSAERVGPIEPQRSEPSAARGTANVRRRRRRRGSPRRVDRADAELVDHGPEDARPARARRAAGRRLELLRGIPAAGATRPSRRRGARRGGRRQDPRAMRLPRYSSSVPASAIGTMGAPVRRAISAAPSRMGRVGPGARDAALRASGRRPRRLRARRELRRRAGRSPTPPRQTGSMPADPMHGATPASAR